MGLIASLLLLAFDITFILISAAITVVTNILGRILPAIFAPKKSIAKQVALVTGSANGLGRLLAVKLAQNGARLILVDKNEAGNEETAELVRTVGGSEAFPFTCDLTNREDIYRMADTIQAQVGDVDILVNNAGFLNSQNFLDTPDDVILKSMEINYLAHCWMIRSFLPRMLEKNQGQIVTISSVAGLIGSNRLTDYCASKHAAVGFHKSLAMELDALGCNFIKMTLVCPSTMKTQRLNQVKLINKFPFLFPSLEPEAVAKVVTDGILRNLDFIGLPFFINGLFMIHSIFPYKLTHYISRLYGVVPSMNGIKSVGEKKNSL